MLLEHYPNPLLTAVLLQRTQFPSPYNWRQNWFFGISMHEFKVGKFYSAKLTYK